MAMMIITLSLDCKHCSARPGWNDIKCFATSPGLIRLPSSKVAGLEEWCKRGNSNAGTSSVMGRIRALPWPPVSHASSAPRIRPDVAAVTRFDRWKARKCPDVSSLDRMKVIRLGNEGETTRQRRLERLWQPKSGLAGCSRVNDLRPVVDHKGPQAIANEDPPAIYVKWYLK